jgi:hypothetical protein
MSTLYKIAKIKLNNKRAPSHALIMRLLGVYLAAGHKAIDLHWRGDFMQLDCDPRSNEWRGLGTINQESGHNIARELNKIRQFVLDHFQIIRVNTDLPRANRS